ncbi:hypothetical protein [Nocardia jinanensis]|nr:hypothetical protein [Nocardia jinanensis]
MRQFMYRLALIAFTATVGVLLGAGSAAAVTPEQCESHGGFVDIVLDPNEPSRAVCTCRNDPVYDGMQVFGRISRG